jgi:hypothetical protein
MGLVTLAAAKDWLGVIDGNEDQRILGLIEAASVAVEGYCGHALTSGTVTETLIGWGGPVLFVTRPPVTSITSVVLLDGGTTVPCEIDRGHIRRTDRSIFVSGERYSATYVGGFTTVPADVQLATKMTIQAMRNAQVMDPNLTGENLGGVWGGGFDSGGPGSVPRNARSLLEDYVLRIVP